MVKEEELVTTTGSGDDVGLEKVVEALQDPSTGLTHPALTGVRKQSVQDVERIFSQGIIDFMKRNNYDAEAKYLSVVRNWRRAIGGEQLMEGALKKHKDSSSYWTSKMLMEKRI